MDYKPLEGNLYSFLISPLLWIHQYRFNINSYRIWSLPEIQVDKLVIAKQNKRI